MKKYLLKRLVMIFPLLLGISIICFGVMHLAPGKPTDMETMLNPRSSAEAQARMTVMYGLDKPLYEQYWLWLQRAITLDFGKSFSTDRRPVIDKIAERLPVTIALNLGAMVVIFIIAVPLGVTAAIKQNSIFDNTVSVLLFLGLAVPSFWLALILMRFFGVELGWLPISGLRSLNHEYLSPLASILDFGKHLILPLFVAVFGGLAGLSRYMRSNMLEVIRQDYITVARSKGISENSIIFKHALRNALLPVITILGLSVPGLIGGSVILETVFALPGMGQLFYIAVMARDYPTIMGILVIGSLLTLLGNLLADIAYAYADPRIRIAR
ncbi:MAG: ABC transporter permease [Deltaproteobacteria bacterium]|nr:ABC transporter permease [Deltaproteobacteria bacterium]